MQFAIYKTEFNLDSSPVPAKGFKFGLFLQGREQLLGARRQAPGCPHRLGKGCCLVPQCGTSPQQDRQLFTGEECGCETLKCGDVRWVWSRLLQDCKVIIWSKDESTGGTWDHKVCITGTRD